MFIFDKQVSTKSLISILKGYGALQSCYRLCISLNALSHQHAPMIIPKLICKAHACWNWQFIIQFPSFFIILYLTFAWIGSIMTQSTLASRHWLKLTLKVMTWTRIWSKKKYLCLKFFNKFNDNMVKTFYKHNASKFKNKNYEVDKKIING